MKVLLTGAFGNLGANTLKNLMSLNRYEITCFDVETPANKESRMGLLKLGAFETVWGDICSLDTLKTLVKDQDCILHLAAIIPPLSELKPGLAKKVNIEGTHNLISAALEAKKHPKFIFTSSVSVHGPCHSIPPPRHAGETPKASDNYTYTKIESENELRKSGLPWTILRIGAAVPMAISLSDLDGLKKMFEVPLAQRVEFVHPYDVATAIANAVAAETTGKILYLGGGEKCQMTNREFMAGLFDAIGVDMPSESAFKIAKSDDDFWYTDFMDTEESQMLLKFQKHSFDEFLDQLKQKYWKRRTLIRLVSPIARWFIMMLSPYPKKNA